MEENINRLETMKARLEAEVEAFSTGLDATEYLNEETYQACRLVVDSSRSYVEGINDCLKCFREVEAAWARLAACGTV